MKPNIATAYVNRKKKYELTVIFAIELVLRFKLRK